MKANEKKEFKTKKTLLNLVVFALTTFVGMQFKLWFFPLPYLRTRSPFDFEITSTNRIQSKWEKLTRFRWSLFDLTSSNFAVRLIFIRLLNSLNKIKKHHFSFIHFVLSVLLCLLFDASILFARKKKHSSLVRNCWSLNSFREK